MLALRVLCCIVLAGLLLLVVIDLPTLELPGVMICWRFVFFAVSYLQGCYC